MNKIYYDSNSNIILGECPFCGSVAEFQNEWHPIHFEIVGRYVQCTNCLIRIPTSPITYSCPPEQVDLEVAKIWNRRTKY